MRSKISVVGEQGNDLAGALGSGDRHDVVALNGASPDLAGSDVVVLAGGDVAGAASAVARRAPAAVLIVATADHEADCAVAVEASLLPRPRVIGVPADAVTAAVEAVLFGRGIELRAAVLCRGEEGVDERVATVTVWLSAGGVRRIGEEPC
jgi:malate/lactate dehydrogenase